MGFWVVCDVSLVCLLPGRPVGNHGEDDMASAVEICSEGVTMAI